MKGPRPTGRDWLRIPSAVCAAGMVLLLVAGPVAAEEPPATADLQQRLQQLEQQHKALQEKFDKQQEEREREGATKRPNGQKKQGESPWLEVGKDLRLSTAWDNGFVAETADKAFHVRFGGRVEFDNSWFTQDDNLLIGPSPDTRLRDGSLFRRARLRTDGQVWEFIDFVLEVNFANAQDASNVSGDPVQVGSVGLTDVYLTFRELPYVGNVRVGHQRAPVGLERYSSYNTLYYMERSSLFDAFLGPNHRQNGVVVFDSYLGDRVTLAGCATRIGRDSLQSFGFDAEDGAYAAGGRLTALPVYAADGRVLMHVGAGYQHQALVGNRFSAASRPLLRSGSGGGADTPNLVATGTFFSPNGANVLDLEWAAVCGPFSMSAEYALAWTADVFASFNGLTFAGPRGDATAHAAYVEAGYFLTPGDYRRYDKKTGTWARTVPQENAFVVRGEDGRYCCGRGAVQMLARYTYLDLVSGSPALTPESGGARAGTQQDVTLGVNWYLNSQTWVMVNYVWSHIDSVVPGASGDLHGIGCRFHIDF